MAAGPAAVGLMAPTHVKFLKCSLPMNRLVNGNLSLVNGDLQKFIPSVTLFSISSYQLPVTSYQSNRFMTAEQVRKDQGAFHEPAVARAPMANEQ